MVQPREQSTETHLANRESRLSPHGSEDPQHLRGAADVVREVQGDGSFLWKVLRGNPVSCIKSNTPSIQLCRLCVQMQKAFLWAPNEGLISTSN